jgi:hypothetical protein
MAPASKRAATGDGELRFTIPPALLQAFSQSPRVVIKWQTAGLWPIDPGLLQKSELLQRLAADKEFNQKFEVVVMPKG